MLSFEDKRKVRRMLGKEDFVKDYPSRLRAAKILIRMVRFLKLINESAEGEVNEDKKSILCLRNKAADEGVEVTPQEMTDAIAVTNYYKRFMKKE